MKVSVILLTYNHVRFIRQAVSSVLRQETDFEFEVLIIEDFSTDGTRDVVIEFANNYPQKIRLLLSPINICDNIIVMNALQAARGEYIAFLDGDDFWTSPAKLQKQVEFMDRRPECVFSWHPINVVDADGNPLGTFRNPRSQTAHTIEDFLARYPEPATGSVIIRNSVPEIPQWYRSCPVGDYPLWVIALQYGTAAYLDEVLSAYRVHSGGAWSGGSEVARRELSLSCYRSIYQNIDSKYHKAMRKTLAESWWTLAAWKLLAGQKETSRSTAREGLKECPRVPRLLILSYAPWAWIPLRMLYRLARRPKRRNRAERQEV